MTDLEVLNVVMEKYAHGKTLPMRLNILLNGAMREIEIPRDDPNPKIQELVYLLSIELLKKRRNRTVKEIMESAKHLENVVKAEAEEEEAPTKYEVRVRTGPNSINLLTVLAWRSRDARVMAYILAHPNCPFKGTPEVIFKLAMEATEIVQ